jgi:hypothetical protein
MGNYARVRQPQTMKPAKTTLFAGGIATLHGLAADKIARSDFGRAIAGPKGPGAWIAPGKRPQACFSRSTNGPGGYT